MKNRKKLAVACAATLGFILGIGGTNAYLTSYDQVVNVVGIGKNTTNIVEEFPTPSPLPGDEDSELPKTDLQMENTVKYSKDYDMGLEEDILDKETSSEADVKKLVSYYINNLKFRPVSEYTILKPHFERTCYTLIQDVENLQHKREAIWYSHDQDNEMG